MEDDARYNSPLSLECQAAVGRLVTAWATMEHSLKLQIGRLSAVMPGINEVEFSAATYVRTAFVAGSGGFNAASKQVENLMRDYGEERVKRVHGAFERLGEVKSHRDTICHSVCVGGEKDTISFSSISASRAKPFVDKTFSIKEIDAMCDKIRKNLRLVDREVTDATGLTNQRVSELVESMLNRE